MKFRNTLSVLLLAAAAVFAAGRQEAQGADSPTAVLEKALSAIKCLDYETLTGLSSGELKEKYRQIAENFVQLRKSISNGDKDAKARYDEAVASLKNWRIEPKSENICGDLAEVYYVSSGNPQAENNGPNVDFFRRVDGEWKWINYDDYIKARKAQYAPRQGDTPSAIAIKYTLAIRDLNFYAAADLSFGEAKSTSDKAAANVMQAKVAAGNGDPESRKWLNELGAEMRKCKFELKGEKIDGDLATVEILMIDTANGKKESEIQRLKLVGGEWKCIDAKDYQKELAEREKAARKAAGPSEVVKKCVAAIKKLDFDTAVRMTHGEMAGEIRTIAENFAKLKAAADNGEQEAAKQLESLKNGLKNWKIEITGEKIDGDLAIVDIMISGSMDKADDGPDRQYFKRIDGEWKMISENDYKQSLAAREKAAKKVARQPDRSTPGPSEVMKKSFAAFNRFDFDTVINLSYGGHRDEMRGFAAMLAKLEADADNGDADAKQRLEQTRKTIAGMTVTIISEKIDGDLATVECVIANIPGVKNDPEKQYFKKIDGEWKMISDQDYEKELAERKSAAENAVSPSAVVRKYAAAVKRSDFDAVVKLCHGELKAEFQNTIADTARLRTAARLGDYAAQKQLDEERENAARITVEIAGEKIDGDLAEVGIGVSGGAPEENGAGKAYLKKVGGEWRMISDEEYAREKAAH